MQSLLDSLTNGAKWRDANSLCSLHYPESYWSWMKEQGSLTKRIVAASENTFSLEVLTQSIQRPLYHEQDCLGQAHHLCATIREVVLHAYDQPVVVARSIIPMNLISQHQSGLTDLGTKPLGHLLFTQGKERIRRRQFCALRSTLGEVYGRRTPYEYLGSTILVSEFFLPTILNL